MYDVNNHVIIALLSFTPAPPARWETTRKHDRAPKASLTAAVIGPPGGSAGTTPPHHPANVHGRGTPRVPILRLTSSVERAVLAGVRAHGSPGFLRAAVAGWLVRSCRLARLVFRRRGKVLALDAVWNSQLYFHV